MQETQVLSLGQEDPLEKEMATHSSILAWAIPWTEEPAGLQSMRSRWEEDEAGGSASGPRALAVAQAFPGGQWADGSFWRLSVNGTSDLSGLI